ncbi:MAG: helix-turn-helix transcriptional regulator [Candidatus Pedobacter colombiensis]|uniref:Helix-turn-helix transcriptional regulator n=1 Tax=Candidatus Pedobacter colombiensis TaxID=3121371 RepID=A0AAJ6B7I1_9SPHI|nr:helix-turn-helix transcriptional regulator [Pedobacter sp.]WEK19531.1 MAG: helix-turn-helix transcriptional regulator [Pedobacter sp.]
MNIEQELLFFFSALGTFNGLLLGCYILFRKKQNTIAQLSLGWLLLMLSVRIGKSVFLYFFKGTVPFIVLQIGLSACLFIGPFLYYYIRSSLHSVTSIPIKWKYTILIMAAILLIGGSLFSYQAYPVLWNKYFIKTIYAVWFIYVALAVYTYYKYVLNKNNPPLKNGLLKGVLIGNCAILLAYLFFLFNLIKGTYVSGSILFSFLLYLNIYLIFARKADINEQPGEIKKYQNKKITDKNASQLEEKLKNLISENELYKNPDLKISDVASQMKISSHHLSQLLNDNIGKSFATYINEYRIKEACKKMIREPHIKVEEVGYEVGFNSKSAFFTSFKRIMNTTPTLYRGTL